MTWNYDMDAAPRDGTYILAWKGGGTFQNRAFVVRFISDGDWALFPGYGVGPDNFTAWMPLPSPPDTRDD